MFKRALASVAVAAVLTVGAGAAEGQALTRSTTTRVVVAPSGGFKAVLCRELKARGGVSPKRLFNLCNPYSHASVSAVRAALR